MTKCALISTFIATLAVVAGVMLPPIAAGQTRGPLRTLVEAEPAFARKALETDTRTAFVENFASDAVFFRPAAVRFHEWVVANPTWGQRGLLTWDPAFGRTSSSGDMGYTTGPAEFRSERDPKSEAAWWGYFVSVWERDKTGRWRVVLDLGTETPRPPAPIARFEPVAAMERYPAPALADSKAGLVKLTEAEAAFARAVSERGQKAAYLEFLLPSGRVHRDGRMPDVGREQGVQALDANRKSATWTVESVRVARSADLGYTYGTVKAVMSDGTDLSFAFVRIWERDGSKSPWRIALDIESPIPAATK